VVAKETVIPIKNGFYTVEKLNERQFIHGEGGLTFLERITYSREYGILVATDHYEILVSRDQYFMTPDGMVSATDLREGDLVLTDDNYKEVRKVENTEEIMDMFYLMTANKTFKANGFYLTNN
jgi:hypothetical protein